MENLEEKNLEENNQSEESQDIKKEKNILMAFLCYFGILVIIPLVTDAKKEEYVKFHIKQGLALLIAGIVSSFLLIVPILGWIAYFVISIILLVLFIIGIINALTGKEKELPIIGKYAQKIKI